MCRSAEEEDAEYAANTRDGEGSANTHTYTHTCCKQNCAWYYLLLHTHARTRAQAEDVTAAPLCQAVRQRQTSTGAAPSWPPCRAAQTAGQEGSGQPHLSHPPPPAPFLASPPASPGQQPSERRAPLRGDGQAVCGADPPARCDCGGFSFSQSVAAILLLWGFHVSVSRSFFRGAVGMFYIGGSGNVLLLLFSLSLCISAAAVFSYGCAGVLRVVRFIEKLHRL